jgi:hypothetical protein
MWPTVRRGVTAGLLAGAAFGTTAALGSGGHAHGHAVLPPAVATLLAAGAWGAVLGAAFGVAWFVLEPALPHPTTLAGAGFLVVSLAPWLALPPGVESTLPAATRLAWYAGMMAAGAGACALAVAVHARRSRRAAVAALPLLGVALLAFASLAPAPAGPGALAAWADAPGVVVGQLGLWTVLGVTYSALRRRAAERPPVAPAPPRSAD